MSAATQDILLLIDKLTTQEKKTLAQIYTKVFDIDPFLNVSNTTTIPTLSFFCTPGGIVVVDLNQPTELTWLSGRITEIQANPNTYRLIALLQPMNNYDFSPFTNANITVKQQGMLCV